MAMSGKIQGKGRRDGNKAQVRSNAAKAKSAPKRNGNGGAKERPLVKRLDLMYNGRSRAAKTFRFGLMTFDITTVAFFIWSSMVEISALYLTIDYCIAVVLLIDFAARLAIAEKPLRHLVRPLVLADMIVIGTLLAPAFIENFAFLRVLRVLRLLRSYHILADLRRSFRFFARNEQVIQSVVNLFVFIFFITALVYVQQARINPNIENYLDALYFTVATLTTTGFGDVTLQGDIGHALAVVIMVFGVGLFLRLVQTIFRPQKVHYKCPDCGLSRHDLDAVHCKHCGRIISIETEGV